VLTDVALGQQPAELTQLVAATAEIRSAKMNAAANFFVASTS